MTTEPKRYSNEWYTWVSVEGDVATIGFTDYAASRMEELMAIELKEAGDEIQQGEPCGNVDLSKVVQDIPSPVSGVIITTNPEVFDTPDIMLSDPFGEGWFMKVKVGNPGELPGLLSEEEYRTQTEGKI